MENKVFFQELLHLEEGWVIDSLTKDEEAHVIRIHLKYVRGNSFFCNKCNTSSKEVYDHIDRQWRHLNIFEYKSYLVAEVPRIKCPKCKTICLVKIPWAAMVDRYTHQFHDYVISLLRKMTIKDVEEEAKINWKSIKRILRKAVKRGLANRDLYGVEIISVDEVSRRRGHVYATIVYDLKGHRVLWVGNGRDKNVLRKFFLKIGPECCKAIKAISCDMWDPYLNAIEEYAKQAAVIFDKYHVCRMINKALDKVRKEEHRKLSLNNIDILKNTKYIFLKNPKNLTAYQEQTFEELQEHELKVMRAYYLKETFKHFWDYSHKGYALKFFKKWFWRATHSRLKPFQDVAHTLKRHLKGLLTYMKYRITSGALEGINNCIRTLINRAYGFNTFDGLNDIILFNLGQLNTTR